MTTFSELTLEAIETVRDAAINDYLNRTNGHKDISPNQQKVIDNMNAAFIAGFRIEEGRKYFKLISGSGVHSFVCKEPNFKKGFKIGDILKAASWATPAMNFARGNVLEGKIANVRWTGV